MIGRKTVRGITWIEFSIVLFLIGVFLAVLLFVLLGVQQAAERSMFDWTARNLKIALRLKVTHLMMAQRTGEMKLLVGSNPALLFDGRPLSGYIGEAANGSNYQAGTWYFDRRRRELVYMFHRHWPFSSAGPSIGRLAIEARNRSEPDSMRSSDVEGVDLAVSVE